MTTLRREWGGMALSLALHLLLLLTALWYAGQRPQARETALRALPVDLVRIAPAETPGPSADEAAPARRAARAERPSASQQASHQQQNAAPLPEGTRPDGVKQPEDELSARLRALAQLRQPDTGLPDADNDGGGGTGGGGTSLKDFVRAQILRRWWPDLSIPGARNLPVLVRVKLLRTGIIDDVEIVDRQRFLTDKPFRNMALSARNAAMLASPIDLPPGNYPKVTMLTIDLDPKAVLR